LLQAAVFVFCQKEMEMLGTVLLVILILMLLGALPTWNHSRSWGYRADSGSAGPHLIYSEGVRNEMARNE
jgi:hypothetical protein